MQGAATARNGAAVAVSDVLLFLDDDVEPGAGVVAAHVAFMPASRDWWARANSCRTPRMAATIGAALCGWWETMGDALADPRHRFSFRDVLTGHCSMSKRAFDAIGGFDVSLRCHEDFDFGFRAIEQGFDVRYVREAHAVHHDDSDLKKIVGRKFDEGIASVQLISKHPRMLRMLLIGRPAGVGRLQKLIRRAAVGQTALSGSSRRASPGHADLRCPQHTRQVASLLDLSWISRTGAPVASVAGGSQGIRAIREQVEPVSRPPLVVDLALVSSRPNGMIDDSRPHALRVVIGEHLVGDLEDEPGAERLRGAHLKPILLKAFAPSWRGTALRAGSASGSVPRRRGTWEVSAAQADTGGRTGGVNKERGRGMVLCARRRPPGACGRARTLSLGLPAGMHRCWIIRPGRFLSGRMRSCARCGP